MHDDKRSLWLQKEQGKEPENNILYLFGSVGAATVSLQRICQVAQSWSNFLPL
jgi:hypothetical protein